MCSYYHGRIPRTRAVELLEGNKDGTFLLRMSESQQGVYTLSINQLGAVRHIRVINSTRGYRISDVSVMCSEWRGRPKCARARARVPVSAICAMAAPGECHRP